MTPDLEFGTQVSHPFPVAMQHLETLQLTDRSEIFTNRFPILTSRGLPGFLLSQE